MDFSTIMALLVGGGICFLAGGLLCWMVLARRRAGEDFRSVVEHSIQGILVLDGVNIVFGNEAFARMFGYDDVEEILRIGALDCFADPEDFATLRDQEGRRVVGEFTTDRVRWRGLRADGSRIWVDSISNSIQWSGKRMLLAALVDVTDEVERLEETRSAEARLLSALNAMGQPVALFDVDDRLVVCNEIYRGLLGDKAQMVKVGMLFEEILELAVVQGIYEDSVKDKETFLRRRLAQHRDPVGSMRVVFENGRATELHE